MRSLHSCIAICVLATVHISCHAGWSDILVLLYCKVCVKFLHFFSKFIWVHIMYRWFNTYMKL